MGRKPPPPSSRYNLTASIGVIGNILLITAVTTDYWYVAEDGRHGGLYRNVEVASNTTLDGRVKRDSLNACDLNQTEYAKDLERVQAEATKAETRKEAQVRCDAWKREVDPPKRHLERVDGPTGVIIKKEFDFYICCNDDVAGDNIILTCETTTWRDIVQKMLIVGLTSYSFGTFLLFLRMENSGQNCIMGASLFLLLGVVSYTGGIMSDAIPGFVSYSWSYAFGWMGVIVNISTFITWIYLNNREEPNRHKRKPLKPPLQV